MSSTPVRARSGSTASQRFRFAPRYVRLVHFIVDSLVWVIAMPSAALLRYDFDPSLITWGEVVIATIVAIVAQGVFGYLSGLYRRRFRYGSFDEVVAVAGTVLLAGLSIYSLWFFGDGAPTVPRTVPPLATALTLTGAVSARSIWRLYQQQRRRPAEGRPLVIIGAGEGAVQIIQALLGRSDSPYLPVAILDDDPLKAKLRIQGVPVVGGVADLVDVSVRFHSRHVLLTIANAGSEMIRYLSETSADTGLSFLVLPPVDEMFGAVSISDIRPMTDADLLGREPAEIDHDAVADYVTGKRVLVTGAGGSIGSELCRQLRQFEPSALIMLDRDESGLHAVQLSIEGRAMLDDPNLVLADIRDAERIREVFLHHRPEVVFHAAALKHLTLLEGSPAEAWKTNVVGTQNVLDAALEAGVARLVNISTDKAANPTSVLGYSKRMTERLTAHAAAAAPASTFVSVRFGNVLGSRGSVLTAFRAQAAAGGPITVTHPEVTRYFMSVEEAVRLTIYAGAIGTSSEVLVLDMGSPVRIVDVARRFAMQHDPPLEIVFTGLRSGEKLHENLIADGEVDARPVHPLVTHVKVPPLEFERAKADLFAPLDEHRAAHEQV